ncbi:glycerophosphodiester phosphodiesterase [Tessaracoccus sp. OS52]|uniref:glycerophosphodiester phosphodiesterase n=1 Tax=Tessaracoccus sp. OS52 TaxID=2886691 RepID=UPI001D0FF8EC|nr:glycerophosphodiester phosphodiesterase [Tessaracoccus sp. OS52]MCC2594517.1 glycerophosphodiester phosphodiesterase [Tessaracoccus sp. OS52]
MTEIWAHRGAPAFAPENTLPAFETAVQQGADGIEFDVQRTADGHLVVIHDESINRTSNGFGRVVDLTLEELRRCDFSNGFVGFRNTRIPTLKETLQLLGPTGVRLNIELKNTVVLYPGMELEALELVEEAGVLEQVVFSSFNHVSLANLRGKVEPENLGLLYSDALFEPWTYANFYGAGAVHPSRLALKQPHYMWLCHEAGIKAHVWTVDDDEEIQQFTAMGVDAIITNFPDRARRVSRRSR